MASRLDIEWNLRATQIIVVGSSIRPQVLKIKMGFRVIIWGHSDAHGICI